MKQFFVIILFCVSFMFAACTNGKTAELSSKVNADEQKVETKPNPLFSSTPKEENLTENARNCQPKNVSSIKDSPQIIEANETIPTPDNRDAFNSWLTGVIGSIQVAALPNRNFINEYYWEGDLNADGCRDVAILVEAAKDKSAVSSADDLAAGTTVQNLRSKAIFKGGDVANFPFSEEFALRIKPTQEIAIAIVFGGQKGWSWKRNVAGREFLIYDSVFKPFQTVDYETASTLFSIVEKNKPDEDDADLLDQFPPNAVGDCIYTAIQIKRKKVVFSELSNKFLICFDGKAFFSKKLPDSKSYPE